MPDVYCLLLLSRILVCRVFRIFELMPLVILLFHYTCFVVYIIRLSLVLILCFVVMNSRRVISIDIRLNFLVVCVRAALCL